VKSRAAFAFLLSAALGAAVWAFSIFLTGKDEPWDAEGLYYLVALGIAGAIAGAAVPDHLGAHYIGAFSGQVAYELVFLKLGPLFILGLAFLAGYSIIFLVAAAAASSLRKRLSNADNAA
jgi:hypothetical protein